MDLFSIPTFREKPRLADHQADKDATTSDAIDTACPHFAGFMAVCLAEGNEELGLHPFITNALPDFEDVSLGGGSMDVRRVKASSFPVGLSSGIFTRREFVIVKHPRVAADDGVSFCDIALELQILRHPALKKHDNIIDLLSVMYHDTGNVEGCRILPALVLEFAEYGSVKTFQELGNATSFQDKLCIAIDTANGLEVLHSSGVVHGDVKPSNLLVCKHATRKFIVKVSDFGFSIPLNGGCLIGSTEMYRAPEADEGSLQGQYLRQLDIYSFGLTLWTIMGDGVPFWSAIPEEDRSENISKMKKSNTLAVLAPSNILIRMRDDALPLLILCRILFYSLQSSPENRFRDISEIICLLSILQSILQSMNEVDATPSHGLRDALASLRKLAPEGGSADSFEHDGEQNTLQSLITLLESLKDILSSSKDDAVKAMAALSLSCAYVNELGVQYDLDVAADYVVKAAHLGYEMARTVYINAFCHIAKSGAPDQETLRTWLIDSAEAGNSVARRKLEADWPSDVARLVQMDKEKEMAKAGITIDSWAAELSLSQDEYTMEQTRRLLLWSIVEDIPATTSSCLYRYPNLLQETLENGETPVLTAARLGRGRIIEAMLQNKDGGSLANIAGANGVTPLHWLCSFPDSDHETIASLLCKNGADPNALAVGISISLHGINILDSGALEHTPLYWAIMQNRLSAVEALIKRGADATFRIKTAPGVAIPMSAFDLSCRQSHSSIVARLLEEGSVRRIVNLPKPMVTGDPVHVRPLFEAVKGFSRWARLLNSGVGFEEESRLTIKALLDNGATTDAVLEAALQLGHFKMPAVFATAYHQCSADIMVSGLQLGFYNEIDASVGKLSNGGSAIFVAITHHDRAMFLALLNAGASLTTVDANGLTPLQRASKETDDIFFVKTILGTGIPVDPTDEVLGAFGMAIYCGNLTVARYLYDQGANRDRLPLKPKRTILGEMLTTHTRNALQRVKFLLSLPDRVGSDGFVEFERDGNSYSAFHLLVPHISELLQATEITGIMVSELLRKYHTQSQIDNTIEPNGMTALATAAFVGNHLVAQRLLEHGANPNIPDQRGRTALDLVHGRYCFPEATLAFQNVDTTDQAHMKMAGIVKLIVNGKRGHLLIECGRHASYMSTSTPQILGLLGLSSTEVQQMWDRREMPPRIESQYLGDIVHKCWHYEYEDAQALKTEVLGVLRAEGWEVEGDELSGFDAAALFKDDMKESAEAEHGRKTEAVQDTAQVVLLYLGLPRRYHPILILIIIASLQSSSPFHSIQSNHPGKPSIYSIPPQPPHQPPTTPTMFVFPLVLIFLQLFSFASALLRTPVFPQPQRITAFVKNANAPRRQLVD
ncbi:hypothetical protein G7Z17_g1092 [Cylindrodendrum hubeiense]|uniref:Protein kinase domain-containing protein n=1 Tax=Cylindrodendrum hubeiense TaxID=595255 RepID=A0A9P5HNF8_9HYPO|nr:hypothetical protein G7Z17_g1092 [Cylindrodendrum hubeiense]